MNVPIEIIGPLFVALLSLQAWTLKELVALKIQVATLNAKMEARE
jgi:hypothetical protein